MKTTSPIVVFLGPSLPWQEAADIVPGAEFRPPIRRGDLVKLVDDPPAITAIVDGLLFHNFAISPKEVLLLLRAGAPVYGSSSIGALRAVELEPFGMRGIGRVFRMYRSGRIDADDEVAMAYSADGCEALSDAMVNIRHGLSLAQAAGVISGEEARALARVAKRLYFPERTWERVLVETRRYIPVTTSAALATFLRAERPDVKRDDAIELLRTIAASKA